LNARNDTFDLKAIITKLITGYAQISSIRMFGSRRYRTRSTRSDLDLLVFTNSYLTPEDLRDFALKECPIIDFFIAEGPAARSCANGSTVKGFSRGDLISRLGAILIWDRSRGFANADVDWQFEVIKGYAPPMTTLWSGVPLPSKVEAISSRQGPGENRIGRVSWKHVASHPIAIIAYCVVFAVSVAFGVVNQLRTIPLQEQIGALRESITDKNSTISQLQAQIAIERAAAKK
jgi:hypothetical protein